MDLLRIISIIAVSTITVCAAEDKNDNGTACKSADDCKSGICTANKCVQGTKGLDEDCVEDEECRDGLQCVSHRRVISDGKKPGELSQSITSWVCREVTKPKVHKPGQ